MHVVPDLPDQLLITGVPVTHDGTVWFLLRLVAGAASALIFVIAVSAMLSRLRAHAHHLIGWAFGGVGAGIALSGLLVAAVQTASTWQAAWWTCAACAALLAAVAWPLAPTPEPESSESAAQTARPRTHRWFLALLASYTFEGIGYIIAGTFLVAAIQQGAMAWLGSGARRHRSAGTARWCHARARIRRAVRRHFHGRQHDCTVHRCPPSSAPGCGPVDRWVQRRPDPRPAARRPAAQPRLSPGARAGGPGFLAGGYKTGQALAGQLHTARAEGVAM